MRISLQPKHANLLSSTPYIYDFLHFLPLIKFECLLVPNTELLSAFFINLHKFQVLQWPGLHPPGQGQFKRANVLGSHFEGLTRVLLRHGGAQGRKAGGLLTFLADFPFLYFTIFSMCF